MQVDDSPPTRPRSPSSGKRPNCRPRPPRRPAARMMAAARHDRPADDARARDEAKDILGQQGVRGGEPVVAQALVRQLLAAAASIEKKVEYRRPDQDARRDRRPSSGPDQRVQRRRARPEPAAAPMAEGLDERGGRLPPRDRPRPRARRATRAAASPASSRPEPLFEPRPLEGDEKTGDTRDAGEDERLKAIERRVADGRGEEGDAEAHPRRPTPPPPNGRRRRAKPRQPKPDEARETKATRTPSAGRSPTTASRSRKSKSTSAAKPTEVSLEEALKGYVEQDLSTSAPARSSKTVKPSSSRAPRSPDRPGPPDLPATARIYRPGDGRPLSQGTQLGARFSTEPGQARPRQEKVYQAARIPHRRNAARAGRGQQMQAGAGRRPARGADTPNGANRVQTKNRNHRHRDAEQRIFSDAQGRHGSLRLQRTGNRDRLRSPNAARPPGRQRIPTHDG